MIGIVLGWALFIFIAYKTSQVELDFKDFDPYAELEIDRVCQMYQFPRQPIKLFSLSDGSFPGRYSQHSYIV